MSIKANYLPGSVWKDEHQKGDISFLVFIPFPIKPKYIPGYMGYRIPPWHYDAVLCNHENRMGKGWATCNCGAHCVRDKDGSIIEFYRDSDARKQETTSNG